MPNQLPPYLSMVTANYLQAATLGSKAESAGAKDKDINDIIDEKNTLTDKARYMDGNISAIQAIKLNFEAGVVGIQTNVQFKFKDKKGVLDKELNDLVEKDWKLFCKPEFFETRELYHCNNILRQIVKAEKGADGEVLILHQFNTKWKFRYKTQLVETSMIDDSKDTEAKYDDNGKKIDNAIIGGMEISDYGEPIGIWIYEDINKIKSTYFTSSQYTLYFNPHLRINQYRGITQLSGVIGTIQNTMTYTDTELDTAALTARVQMVHKTPVIKPLREKQDAFWKSRFANMNTPSISEFRAEDQSNSPTAFIGLDEDLTYLNKGERKSTYDAFLSNYKDTIAANYNISNNSILKGEADAVFAVVKAQKQENETRYGIEQDNIKNMVFETIINNFILTNHRRWKIKDFYDDKYKYYYQYNITLGAKTELDEVKSANARKINLDNKTIDKYQSSLQLGNDYDTVVENNTRASLKDMEEMMKLLDKLKEVNEKAKDSGMKFKLDENNNIILDETIINEGAE